MFLFGKKRKDGKLVTEGDPMIHIMPYVMRGRNESAVYYTNTIDIENIQKYIREQRKNNTRVTLFNIIVTTILQIFYTRPHMNRFVAGRRLYDHNDVEILYTVKISMNDNSYESVARVKFDGDDNLSSVTEQMNQQIEKIKQGSEGWDDKLIHFFAGMPRWFLRAMLGWFRWLDFHGMMPKTLIDIIPMYSSMFISHLGSIGGNAAFHHLYEFGTTSIFMTISKVYEKPFKTEDGGIEWHKVIDLNFTIDERIVDGFYLIKSLKLFNQLLENLELLEYSPNELKELIDKGTVQFGRSKINIDYDKIKNNDKDEKSHHDKSPLELIIDQEDSKLNKPVEISQPADIEE